MSKYEFDQPTRQMAEYAVGLNYNSISRSAVKSTVRHLLDAIGCAIGAQNSRPALVTQQIAATATSDIGASVIGLINSVKIVS